MISSRIVCLDALGRTLASSIEFSNEDRDLYEAALGLGVPSGINIFQFPSRYPGVGELDEFQKDCSP